nr:peptidoglycan DD-metalloendopeptidase family protein [Fredinandcohnia sp. SECRCQ15]
MLGTASAESNISTVYHIYIDGNRIGTVDNIKLVDQVIDKKIESIKKDYSDLSLTADDLSVIQEQVFRANANNAKTIQKLESEVHIVAKATALSIDGKPVAYLKNKEAAEDALKLLKLKYVKVEELTALEARAKSDTPLPALKEGQSRILDVAINQNVSLSEEEILPNEILTPVDTVKLLQKGTLEEKKYKVKEGDVLGAIAIAHGLSTKQLLELNPQLTEESVLQIDQEVNVTAYKPLLTVTVKKEESKKETIAYKTEVKEDSNMYKGDNKVTQEGQEGEKVVNYNVELVNGQVSKRTATSENIIKEPVNHVVVKGTKVVPSRGTGSLSWPAVGGYISSKQGYRWGRLHKGIDIARPSNHTIKAADNGTVIFAGYDGSFGNKIMIDHNNGIVTLYAHMSSLDVHSGQTVSQGQAIGVMGATGNSTGVHLHFEVYKNGSLQNPLSYLR